MKNIGIITAMSEEADLIIEKYSLKKVNTKGTLTIFHGTLDNNNLILLLGGIGKIQAAFSTTHLLENYKIDLLINIGIAGNLSKEEINIGDVILPNKFIQHDIYLPFGGSHLDYAKAEITIKTPLLDKEGLGVVVHNNLRCLTGDQFIDDEEILNNLEKDLSGNLVEMEAFAILSIARNYDILDKTIVIKGISDGANNEAIDAHMSNLEIAMKNSIIVLDEILKKV
ncbi:MAG: 5'-methylthioadenosine/S-adenosylhomocysteine nucleosidase [Candidatus Gracilibacteria bacterium]|nr:5'-methylthioadenosine/S-adenosylhomocysteine nucleosidase [Candidatus Gracilibacteria bacterium]MDQ7022723.1 5'-methylthioadenosine/S-adenosylhomocysteine nucleosidase [Candidatus Gracilibacteria bacterium]